MNTSLRWRLIIAFLLVFCAGLALGFLGGLHPPSFFFRHAHRGFAAHMQRELRAIGLTPEQMKQAQPTIDRTSRELNDIRRKTARDVAAIFERTHNEIAAFLTPEQKQKMEKMRERHRRIMRLRGMSPPPAEPEPSV
ncbi:MAG: hypothetical protein M3R59_06060 [Verrucomicrobiota bacterium]|nr:hypothetical protein [Verrucomicrobiota bacterium]